MSEETKLTIHDDPLASYPDRAKDRWLAPYMMSVEGLISDHNREGVPFEPYDSTEPTPAASITGCQPIYNYRSIELDELIFDQKFQQNAREYDLIETLMKMGFKIETSPTITESTITLPERFAEVLAAVNRDRSKLWESQTYMEMYRNYSADDFRRLYECHWDFNGTVKPGRY